LSEAVHLLALREALVERVHAVGEGRVGGQRVLRLQLRVAQGSPPRQARPRRAFHVGASAPLAMVHVLAQLAQLVSRGLSAAGRVEKQASAKGRAYCGTLYKEAVSRQAAGHAYNPWGLG
jgi:hypothetical protein